MSSLIRLLQVEPYRFEFLLFLNIMFLLNVKRKRIYHFIGSVQTLEGEKSMPKKAGVTTSEVVKFMNDLFHSVNGNTQEPKKTRNALRTVVTAKSCHSIFWKEAAPCMAQNIQFVHPHTKKPKSAPPLKIAFLNCHSY